MVDTATIKDLATVIGTIVAGAIASVLSLRRLVRHWEKEGLEIERVNAEGSLIKSLRSESERMASQNQKLMEHLITLQTQISELHLSINNLRAENDILHGQVSQLHREINEMRKTDNANL